MIHGFDISAYQSSTSPAGDFVFVKATEGATYTSSRFDAQWASAKTRAAVRGAYHFARPEQSSAQHQADRLIALARPVPGELLCLDLEASGLSQAATNAWARLFGQRLRERAPGVRTVLYMGSGYAANGTGRGLNAYFDLWWYPQYPTAYQLTSAADIETERAANRSSLVPQRTLIAASTSRWPPAMAPWLPSGLTCGWKAPAIWQFTDNFGGLDASISPLTIEELAGGGQPIPQEETEMIARDVLEGLAEKTQFPLQPGKFTTVVAFTDNTYTNPQVKATGPVTLRFAVKHNDGSSYQVEEKTVGRVGTDTSKEYVSFPIANAAHAVAVSVTRQSGDGTEPLTVGAY